MKLFLFITVITLFMQSCKNRKDNVIDEKVVNNNYKNILKKNVSEKYVIINDLKQINMQDRYVWHPNIFTVMDIEQLIKQALFNKGCYHKGEIIELDNYYRQYICYVDRSGDSIIHVNAFCELPPGDIVKDSKASFKLVPFDWRHKILEVQDGGSCYWEVIINYSQKTWGNFHMNGEA